MPYTATTNWADVDATIPLGADSPADIDDALRETRAVGKAANNNAHTGKGGLRVALWAHVATAQVASGSADVWTRRTLAEISDPTSLVAVGTHTNSFKPIAGYYKVRFWVLGYKVNKFQCRIAETSGNTITPSAATLVTGGLGSVARADSSAESTKHSEGCMILQADGIKSYCLDQVVETQNISNGWGVTQTTAWAAPSTTGTNMIALVELTYLGATLT